MLALAIAAVVVPALLAQAPTAAASPTHFKVTLEYHGVWGLTTEANGTCPGVTPGTDTLSGEVERTGTSDEGIEYTGKLTRTTRVGLCEVREVADGTRWCAGEITGGGRFLLIITIPLRGNDNESARIEMKPDLNVSAQVGGHCDSLDNAAVAADYEDGDVQYFDTANHAAAGLLPTGGLVFGTFRQSRHVDASTGYTLKVERP